MNKSSQIDNIRELEKRARFLDPDGEQRGRLLGDVAGYGEDFLGSISSAPAYNDRVDNGRGLLDAPISERGIGIEETLKLFQEDVASVGINPTSGRFLGYIPGGGLYYAALGDYLAALTNRYAGIFYASPGAVRMENLLLRWMADMVGYPESAGGNLASGGSIANLTAIVSARDAQGLEGERIHRSVVYLTEQTHHCITKALGVAGLSGCIQRQVLVDSSYRMHAAALEDCIKSDVQDGLLPWLIVSSSGTTNTGSVDPLAEIGEIARSYGLWHHVDGAYGAFFALCPEGHQALKGMNQSDSIVMDPHKTLFLPYGTGAVLVKDRKKMLAAHSADADYMQDAINLEEELDPAAVSPELTKHFRGLRLWLPLQAVGAAPFRAALSEKIQLARYFYDRIQSMDGFEVGPYPDLSIVIYRYVPSSGDADEFNRRLVEAIQQEGRIFISSTRVDGKFVLRMAVGCFRTHLEDIDIALEVIENAARRLEGEQ